MYFTFPVSRIFIQINAFVNGTKETGPKQEFMSSSKYYSKYLAMNIPYIFTQYYRHSIHFCISKFSTIA